MEVREAEDFATVSPEGGCRMMCTDRLGCGHKCQGTCHSEAMHAVWRCEMPCQRRHVPCQHPCAKATCGEDCGICLIKMDGVTLPCDHIQDRVPCHQTYKSESIRCGTITKKSISRCGHTIGVKCSIDVNCKNYRCPSPCSETLSCGHSCPGTCGECHTQDSKGQPQTVHQPCRKICDKSFDACNHRCKKVCHKASGCGLCQQPCEVSFLSFPCVSSPKPPRYDASIRSAKKNASSLVFRALKTVHGPASTKVPVPCHARHHATDCHVICGVPRF